MEQEKLSFEEWEQRQPSDKIFEWGSASGTDPLLMQHHKKKYSELTEQEKNTCYYFYFHNQIIS